MSAHCDGARLRVCVDDATMTPLTPARGDGPEPPVGGGRGLWLVEALADRWGCEVLPDGNRVWFEVPCADGSSARQRAAQELAEALPRPEAQPGYGPDR